MDESIVVVDVSADAEALDLTAYLPFATVECEELAIDLYEIDDRLVLDFDFDLEGPWAHLGDAATLEAFTRDLLQRLEEADDPAAVSAQPGGTGCLLPQPGV